MQQQISEQQTQEKYQRTTRKTSAAWEQNNWPESGRCQPGNQRLSASFPRTSPDTRGYKEALADMITPADMMPPADTIPSPTLQ